METEKLTKKRKKKLILAIVTLYLIVSAFLLGCRFARADTNITVSFGADPLTADVGETITFIWSITGDYQQAIIYFGDGNFDELTDDDGSIIYEYFAEGKYQVILMVVDSVGNINYYPTYITIENIAPQFDISLNVTNNKAWEDENVEISVINLVESEVDMADGVLTYIYDFADGNENQVSTNKSSIIHSWNNAGTYPITITVIDDQAALGQETIEITVVNRPPKAEFDIDVENDYGLSSLDYYASNNWRNDTLGNIPEGWDFHYLDEIIQMNSYQDIIYPSSTVKDRWFKTNILLDDHECIRELDDSCIFIPYWWSTFFGSEGAYDQFNMENLDIINGTVTKVEFVYTSELKNITYVDIDLTADLYVGESWIGSKPLSFSNTKQEYIIIWDELSISQDDLDDLQIKISCKYPGAILNLGVLLDMIDNYGTIDFLMQFYELAKIIFPNYLYYDIYLDSIYLNISYEAEYYTDVHPSTTNLKVVENNDEHNKVVQLQDNSKQNGVSLVKNFEDQNNGTVEFWIKNSEISSQTWSFSLWDDSFMASEIFIDESKWKVKIGSNLYDLESFGGSIGTPSNDWHHVTVDFCTSGAYNNLNQDQFQVTIDGIKSKIYAFDTDLSEINTIKIQSSKENIGTSWIDAIGYTWDPFYKTGDNEAPITTYPDKTTFLFSAADTEDTSSDIDSLRYFWEFGDGLRGYGKYVYHQYTKSGLYRIKLIVKDDNGDIDNFTRFLVVNNLDPEINICFPNEAITIYEGETLVIKTESLDDLTDVPLLEYWWDFEYDDYEFNEYNLKYFEKAGWYTSHIYEDDFKGSAYVMVKDPENYQSYDHIDINVLNVAPTISIMDSNIVADVSFKISRSTLDLNSNFSMNIISDEGVELKYNLNFTDPYDYSLETDKTKISMSLLKDWKIVIMCYENIPIPEYYEYECQLEFLNGETLIFSSGELHGDSDGYWEVDLNQYFYDNKNFNFKYPLTFDTLIWDPSKDDVYVDFIYNTSSLINLECITDLVDGDSYLFTYTMNDVMYNIRIYNENSQIYANITASQILLSQLYDNNAFPTKLEIPATINPLFDFDALTNIIQNELSLSEISLISCLGIIHKVFASVEDDDGGKINQTITYRTYPDIWFGNLSPKLIPGIPDKSMAHNITLYAQISDFNQLFGQYTYDYEHLITSDKKPFDAQSFIETNDKSIYIVDSADTSTLLKLDKDTMSWINIITIDSAYEINKMHYDRDNEKIYLGCSNSISLQLIEIDLIDFNNKSSDIIYAQDFQIIDVIQLLDTLYIATTDMDNGEVYMLFTEFNSESLSWGNSYSINMGSVDVRDFEVSYCVVINDNIYYQWQWNDENVEFWVFNITNKSFKRIKLAFAPIYPIDMSTYHVNSNYNFDYLKKDDTFNFEISTIIYDNSDNGIYEKSLNHAYVDQQETHGESFTGNGAGYVLEADNPWSALENGAGGRRYFNTYDATAFVGGSRDYYDTYNIYSYPAPNGVSSIPYDDETFVLDNIIVDIKEATWEKCCYRYGSVQPYAQLEIKDQISGAWHSMGYYVLPYGTQNPSWKTYQYKSGTWRGYYSGTTTKSSISNYINPNSKLVQTRVHWHGDQLLTVVIFFVPVFELSMYSYQDVWRVETLWRAKNASTQFNFGEELLDGSNDYYLFFQGKTDEGIAELKVNGQTKFNFGDIMETKDWYLIENVSSIEIYQGNSYNVDIDYLYLRPVADCEMNIERPQRSLAYDDLNIISFVLTDSETGKNNFYTYNIDSGSINKVDDLDINLMLDRNTAPENFEKAFQISGNKIYQIGLQGTIELVAELDITGSIIAISDNYLFTDDGSIYELNIPCFNGLCLSNYTDENQLILKELSLNSYLSGQYYTVFEKDFAFTNQGSYLVTMTADDGELITTNGAVIEIDLPDPFASIGDLPEGIIEDQQVELTSDILIFGSNEVNPSDYKFMWSFGDGTYAYVQNPVHAWSNSGTYKISLIVEDCYGDIYMAATNISIEEQKPEIKGPFSFQGVEGQAIILDLEIYDSFLDEQWLKYTWYDENGNEKLELKNNKKPTIILDDGNYIYTLEVEDQDNNIATANINILVEDIPPTIFVSSYIYSGAPGNDLELKAYVSDYFNDFDNLKYEWTIKAGMNSYYFIDKIGGQCSQIIFENCEHTTIYHGTLKVTDEQSGKISVSNFVIDSIIDENQNGVNDFIEWMLDESEKSYNPGIFYPDSDNDNYIDIFEQRVGSETLWNVTDTDGDGLLDGFNDQFIGEYTAGTSPNDPDTDDDLLNDSIEVLGWDITSEITGVIHVISNPLNGDTDSDGLSDYTEFIKGTDPRTPDTDKDGLLDGFDPFPMKQDGDDDGLSDYREFMIGTELNNSDTDGDGLSDGQEVIGWGFQTNPLTSDSDHDFLADNAETTVYKFELNERLDLDNPVSLKFEEYCTKALSAQISFIIAFGEAVNDENTYGIQDVPDLNVKITKADDNLILFNENTNKSRYFSKAIDIREMIENRSLDYRGEYVISINETDAGCLLEQFKIIVTKYLDPNNPDYDGDEIMDGVETSLLVNGNQKIDFKDIYLYNNLTIFEDSTSFNEFLLEIPDIGVVFDANVSIKIESNEITKGAGNLNLQIIKEDINMSIGDYVLINYVDTFSSDSIYIYETTLDLSDFIELGLIGEYYGTYKLKIQIISSDFTDVFNVTEFYFDTATFIQAGAKDTDAWMTNPAKWDTDGDGWSDKFEIYERDEPTNPLNDDTDADGVKDSRDIDPLRDVYIEISPINGYHGGFLWLWDPSPYLEITTSFKSAGTDYFFCTPAVLANDALEHIFIWPWWHIYRNRRAYFDGTHGSPNIHYYADVDDNANSISVNVNLWQMGCLWDTHLLSQQVIYNLNHNKYSKEYTISQSGSSVKLRISTIGLEKVNTIAIYDNSTTFNGHYQEQERMNIIQLYVNDESPLENTPFDLGLNTIVIPTSIFTETVLNKIIQNEEIEESILYEEDSCEFISVGRDGNTEKACDDVDFIFIRFDISAEDAMIVLESLLLTCIINNTTGETALIYNYSSTKEDGYKAVMMNLPNSIVKFIPWLCEYQNSPQGRAPRTFLQWLVALIITVVLIVIAVIFSPFLAIVAIWMLFVAVCEALGLDPLAVLAYLLWCLVRAAVLILIWIIFAIALLIINIELISLLAIILLLSIFVDITLTFEINRITVNGIFNLVFGYCIAMEYNNFWDFSAPVIVSYFISDNIDFKFKMGHFSMELGFIEFPEIFSEIDNTDLNTYYALKSSSSDIYPDTASAESDLANNILELISNIGNAFSIFGGIYSIISTISTSGIGNIGIIALLGPMFIAVLTTWLIFISWDAVTNPIKCGFALIGFAIGAIASAFLSTLDLAGFFVFIYMTTIGALSLETFLITLGNFLSGIGLAVNWEGIIPGQELELQGKIAATILSVISGIVGLSLGLSLLGYASIKSPDFWWIKNGFALASIYIALLILMIGLQMTGTSNY